MREISCKSAPEYRAETAEEARAGLGISSDAGRTENQEKRFSVSEIYTEDGYFGVGVYLDTNIFDGVSPRNWGKVLGRYVYDNLAGQAFTVYDESGREETIYLANMNDRVKKDSAKNSHRVIDKLARYNGNNIRALATVHLSELLKTSKSEDEKSPDNNHQWLDTNGWVHREAYVVDKNGNIYKANLNIADGERGKIL